MSAAFENFLSCKTSAAKYFGSPSTQWLLSAYEKNQELIQFIRYFNAYLVLEKLSISLQAAVSTISEIMFSYLSQIDD